MPIVDIVLVLVLLAAGVHGLRLGALVQVLTFVGFWLGLALGALLVGAIGPMIRLPAVRVAIAVVLILGLATILGVAGRTVGQWSNVVLRRHHLGRLDSALGVGVATVAVLLSAWLVGSVLAQSGATWLSSAIQRSDILRTIDEAMPPVPPIVARVQSFFEAPGFPPVFVELAPPSATPVAVPSSTAARAIGATVSGSTVKVLGTACGNVQEGTGFVAAPGLVVTNAHVVAGEHDTEVSIAGIGYPATVVLFDPGFDLAVLRTEGPLGPPLRLDPSVVPRGTSGAMVGYPEDGPLTVASAAVTQNLMAEGRDIYNQGLVVRDVYAVQAGVQPGNSGSPLVVQGGTVVGVVFSRSTTSSSVGYALASPGVLGRVQRAERSPTAVGTGACTAE